MEGKVKDVIASHLEMFFKLDRAGVKSINAAIDYLSIWDEYQRYNWIKSIEERKAVVADKCKISVKSVEKAMCLMGREI